MRMGLRVCVILGATSWFASCAAFHRSHSGAVVMELNHIRGNQVSCLANCVDMVLHYY